MSYGVSTDMKSHVLLRVGKEIEILTRDEALSLARQLRVQAVTVSRE